MSQQSSASSVFERSFALFDQDGRLVEWDAGFQSEFSSAASLIGQGAAFSDLLRGVYDNDGVARVDLDETGAADPQGAWTKEPTPDDRDHVFEYQDAHGRSIRVNRSRTASGGLVRTARDVTAWRKSDAALSNPGERWCTDGDPTAEALVEFIVNPDGTQNHLPAGEDVRAVYGLSADFDMNDVAALFSRVVQSPAEAEQQAGRLAKVVTTLEPQYIEVRIRGGDERLKWIRFAMTAQRLPDGSTRVCNRLSDVTREKLAEDQLELLRSAVTHATDAIHILHTTAEGATTTVYVNPAYEKITGQRSDEQIGRPVNATGHSGEAFWRALLERIEHDDDSPIECRIDPQAGRPIWVEASATLLERRDDGSHRWVVVSRNIDDRKRSEEELRRARDEADQANKSKSEFLANMSHEIRTPMNGVIGMNALLMRTELTATQHKYAENVRVSADCLLGIINDILDVSKLEAGKVELEEIDFSLQTVVEDVVELLSTRAQEKSLEIASFLDDGARAPLRGDPARLRQIMLNLLSNALKFTERGFVSVEVSSEVRSDDRTALRIEVHDTGIGLSPEAKGKLFQKFQQADGSITRRFGGTGLGLSICRQLIELMGGRIGVDDRRGGGSIFWFEIDLANGKDEGRKPRQGRRDLHDVHILVVDDIELNRNIFARQLESEGAIVTEACGGPECLEAMQKAEDTGQPFAIVVLDHMMPEMAGDETAERIRAESGWTQPKLVLASSIGAPLSTDRAAQAGFDTFLTKPIRQQALIECLAGLIEDEPVEAAQASGASAARAQEARGRGAILLAEDNEINTLLASTLLEEAGYHVTCAVNGVEAVEAVSDQSFDLILMDVQMPVMDGLRATRLIRALGGEAARTPIVAMTANAMNSDRDDCLEAGMDDFVSKPIDPDQFLRVVAQFVADDRPATGGGPAVVDQGSHLPDVDEPHLDGLARLLPAARFKAMLEVYLVGAQGRMDRIEACAEDMDLTAMAAEAHDLKSTSGNFGARRLQFLAEQLETACKTDDTSAVATLAPVIRQASTVAWDIIRNRMEGVDAEASVKTRRAS